MVVRKEYIMAGRTFNTDFTQEEFEVWQGKRGLGAQDREPMYDVTGERDEHGYLVAYKTWCRQSDERHVPDSHDVAKKKASNIPPGKRAE